MTWATATSDLMSLLLVGERENPRASGRNVLVIESARYHGMADAYKALAFQPAIARRLIYGTFRNILRRGCNEDR